MLTENIRPGKRVIVVTAGSSNKENAPPMIFEGVFQEEHMRNFKGGCIDLKYQGMVAVLKDECKVVGFIPGEKIISIPMANIKSIDLVKRSKVI